MKIEVDFNTLNAALATVSSAMFDKKLANHFAIQVKGDEVKLVAFPMNVTCRVLLEAEVLDNETEETVLIQTNLDELNRALSSYRSLSRTVVEKVVLEDTPAKLLMEVHEVSASEEFDIPEQVGRYQLSKNQNLATRDLQRIELEFPEDEEEIEVHNASHMGLFLSSLNPTLDSKAGEGTKSSIMFDDKFAYTVTPKMGALLKNKIFKILAGHALNVQQSQYLLPLVQEDVELEIAKVVTDKMKYIGFRVGEVESFLVVTNTTIKYDRYVKAFNREDGPRVTVDRMYLRDVLRRLDVSSDSCVMAWDEEEEVLRVSSGDFNQSIPVVDHSGDLSFMKVIVAPGTLAKLLVGDDALQMSEVQIFPSDGGKSVQIFITDEKTHWLSFFNATKDRG